MERRYNSTSSCWKTTMFFPVPALISHAFISHTLNHFLQMSPTPLFLKQGEELIDFNTVQGMAEAWFLLTCPTLLLSMPSVNCRCMDSSPTVQLFFRCQLSLQDFSFTTSPSPSTGRYLGALASLASGVEIAYTAQVAGVKMVCNIVTSAFLSCSGRCAGFVASAESWVCRESRVAQHCTVHLQAKPVPLRHPCRPRCRRTRPAGERVRERESDVAPDTLCTVCVGDCMERRLSNQDHQCFTDSSATARLKNTLVSAFCVKVTDMQAE